jgi:hypothetical protein
MNKFLGETKVTIDQSPYAGFSPKDWALHFIERYGQIEGEHHKTWVLDQVSRILHGTPVEIRLAKWSNGEEEYRVQLGKPSYEYKDWVKQMRGKYNRTEKEYEYEYEEGIAP